MTAFQHCLLLLFMFSPLGYASITSHSNKLSMKHLYENYLDTGNPLQELNNASAKCIPPLIETEIEEYFYNEVKGCGIQCQNPFFTKEDHDSTHNLILILASVCFASTFFSVMTFIVSWKAGNRYPGVIIFYINICLAIVSFGWLIQFFPGVREEIVCAYDGTILRNQPMNGVNFCSVTFVLVYSFSIAAVVWFVILTYAWYGLFKQTGTPQDIVKKNSYFHMAAWCIPLVLTVFVIAVTEVDGDSMSGICFVGYNNITMRMIFLLGPISLAVLVGGFFLTCVLYTLIKVKLNSQEVANVHVKKNIHRMILKIGVFSACTVVFVICTFACHAYDFLNRKDWEESLFEYIVCLSLNSASSYSNFGEISRCQFKSKPSVGVVRIHHFCLFGFGIIMSLWVWTQESIESWKRFLYRLWEPTQTNSVAIKSHQLIAKDFQRHHEINQSRISFSINSTHDDPMGMNLDINSVSSRNIYSFLETALPQFLIRRNAASSVVVSFVPQHYSSASVL